MGVKVPEVGNAVTERIKTGTAHARDTTGKHLTGDADNARSLRARTGHSQTESTHPRRADELTPHSAGDDDLPEDEVLITPADKLLESIYGDWYHTDRSFLAREYARSLASLPEKMHRIVADHMRTRPHGGIWLAETNLLDMGHPEWSAAVRVDKPRGWPDGATCNDVGGAYDSRHRAMLVGGKRSGSADTALHEFGHALDDALVWPSQGAAFTEVHARVLPLIQQTSPKAAAYYAQRISWPGRSRQVSYRHQVQ
ncbi:hypothetical protein ACWEH3_31100 [Nocardia sp. NPDC004718]